MQDNEHYIKIPREASPLPEKAKWLMDQISSQINEEALIKNPEMAESYQQMELLLDSIIDEASLYSLDRFCALHLLEVKDTIAYLYHDIQDDLLLKLLQNDIYTLTDLRKELQTKELHTPEEINTLANALKNWEEISKS